MRREVIEVSEEALRELLEGRLDAWELLADLVAPGPGPGPQAPLGSRNHKLRNLTGPLPQTEQGQVKSAFRAAGELEANEGTRKLEQLALGLEREHLSAAARPREGLEEVFTIHRIGPPPSLRKCLATASPIDITHSGVRQKTRRITHRKNGAMVLRWSAAAFLPAEKSYRRTIGHEHLFSDPPRRPRDHVQWPR